MCIWDFQARHMQEDMVPFWNCICGCLCAISECRSRTLGVNGRQLNETSKRAEGPSPRLPFCLSGAIQSLEDVQHYMCREWLDAAWVRNILCRSPVYHQSGVQADDQALKYVQHIKDHCMLCDFRGRGYVRWRWCIFRDLKSYRAIPRYVLHITWRDGQNGPYQVKLSDFFHVLHTYVILFFNSGYSIAFSKETR